MTNFEGISFPDWVQIVTEVITAIGVLIAVTAYGITRKSLYLTTIEKCIEGFRNLKNLNKQPSQEEIEKYIDLVNEELFYFQHGYLPIEIADEWIDGMIDFLPVFNKKWNVLNPNNCIKDLGEKHDRYFQNYPQLVTAFTIKEQYDFTLIYSSDTKSSTKRKSQRRKLIIEILKNLKVLKWYKPLQKGKIFKS